MRIEFATWNSLTHTDSEPDQRGGRMARLDAAARFIPTLMFSLTPATGASVVNREQRRQQIQRHPSCPGRRPGRCSSQGSKRIHHNFGQTSISQSVCVFKPDNSSSELCRTHSTGPKFPPERPHSCGADIHCISGNFGVRNCLRIPPEKQAIDGLFCRIRENPRLSRSILSCHSRQVERLNLIFQQE